MAKGWMTDKELVHSIATNLCEAVVVLPRQLLKVEKLVQSFEMPFSQIQIMFLLYCGERTITDISNYLGIAKSNITPLLDKLCERGMTQRKHSETDRRVVHVSLTEEGVAFVRRVHAQVGEQIGEWEGRFNRSEAKRLNAALGCLLGMVNNSRAGTPEKEE